VTATATNPSGAVEVVHVHSAAATSAPVDGAQAAAHVTPASTQVEGASGTRGANLPVDNLQQASNTIQRGKADLRQTAGAEHRLDLFDGVGGGGGGGGADAGQANAGNATGAVAQGTANEDVSQTGTGGQTDLSAKAVGSSGLPDTDVRSVTT
jgi:hypothetical protein